MRRPAPALAVVLATALLLLPAPVAAAAPVDGDYEARGANGLSVSLTVGGDGTRITATNSFVTLSDYCVWGGAWNAPTDPVSELPPIEISPGGAFSTAGGPESAFGVTSTWTGSFTSTTTFVITVVLDNCPFGQGPLTATLNGAITDPADPVPIGPILPPPSGVGGALGGGQAAITCAADQVRWPIGEVPPLRELTVGRAVAAGCFTDAGGGVFTTQLPARIGGFSLIPRKPGDGLRIDTRGGTVQGIGSTWAVLDRAWDLRGVPPSWLPVRKASARLALPEPVKTLVDLPVAPSVEVKWDGDGRGATVSGEVDWKRAKREEGSDVRILDAGVDGSIKVHISNGAGLELRQASVKLKELNLFGRRGTETALLRLRNVGAELQLTEKGRLWTFSGGLQTSWKRPGAKTPLVIGLRVWWQRGLAGGGAQIDNVETPIPPPPTILERVELDLLVKPSFGLRLRGAARLGPKIDDKPLLRGDPITFGVGWFASECPARVRPVLRMTGKTTMPAAERFKGSLRYNAVMCSDAAEVLTSPVTGRLPTLTDVSGDLDAQMPFGAVHFTGKAAGWIGQQSTQIEGDGSVSLFSIREAAGRVLFSHRALVLCATPAHAPDVGVEFSWTNQPRLFVGCDLGPYRQPRPQTARAAQSPGTATVRVRAGRRTLAIRMGNRAAAPRVRITGPSGQVLESPAAEDVVVREDALLIRAPELGQTFARIDRPRAGTWRIEALDAQAPLGSVATADAVPPLRARARVTGRGATRTLAYRVRPRAGRAVELWDRAAGAGRLLRRTRGGKGRLRFRPVSGRRHRIELVVLQQGVPADRRTLARFAAAAPKRRTVHVRKVSARRRGTRLRVRWRSPARAPVLVEVRLPGGRRIGVLRRTRTAVLTVPRRGRLKVRVAAFDAAGQLGPAATRSVRKSR